MKKKWIEQIPGKFESGETDRRTIVFWRRYGAAAIIVTLVKLYYWFQIENIRVENVFVGTCKVCCIKSGTSSVSSWPSSIYSSLLLSIKYSEQH